MRGPDLPAPAVVAGPEQPDHTVAIEDGAQVGVPARRNDVGCGRPADRVAPITQTIGVAAIDPECVGSRRGWQVYNQALIAARGNGIELDRIVGPCPGPNMPEPGVQRSEHLRLRCLSRVGEIKVRECEPLRDRPLPMEHETRAGGNDKRSRSRPGYDSGRRHSGSPDRESKARSGASEIRSLIIRHP